MHQNGQDPRLQNQNQEKSFDDVTTDELNKMKNCFVSLQACSLQNAKVKSETNKEISFQSNFNSQTKSSSSHSNNHSGNF